MPKYAIFGTFSLLAWKIYCTLHSRYKQHKMSVYKMTWLEKIFSILFLFLQLVIWPKLEQPDRFRRPLTGCVLKHNIQFCKSLFTFQKWCVSLKILNHVTKKKKKILTNSNFLGIIYQLQYRNKEHLQIYYWTFKSQLSGLVIGFKYSIVYL